MSNPRLNFLTDSVHIRIGRQRSHIKRFSIRPLTLLAIIAATAAFVGWLVTDRTHPPAETRKLQQQITQLQQDKLELNRKLAKTEALLALRDNEIASLQTQIGRDRRDMLTMQQRLDMFEDVLAARKVAGVHFLHPSARWQDEHTIAYQLILVKGKNYPRWIIGHLQFTLADGAGHSAELMPAKQSNRGGKIEMTTQSFIEGTLAWPHAWRPTAMTITLINHKGRNKGEIVIPVTALAQTEGAR